METSRKIARFAGIGVTLAASAILMHAQEDKPERRKRTDNSAPQQQAAPPAQHRTERPAQQAAPQAQRTERPAPSRDQQGTPPPQRRDVAPPAQMQRSQPPDQQMQHQVQGQSRRDAPVRTPETHQAQPNNPSIYRSTQPPPGAQPGRTFGNNPPGRPAESPRGQTQMGGRPVAPQSRTFTTRTGDVVHRDSNGQVRQVRMSNGTVVYRPPNGPRRVEMAGPGGRVVVAGAAGHGYVQRPVVIRNTTVIKRTYIYNGVPQARIYRPRVYNGITLSVYTPVRYYRPTFYAYAYNPWVRPISYGWGWAGSPWYGYYGGYFTPYPVYASPSLWLTDYLIAATLEAAYQERMASRQAPSSNIYQQDSGQSEPLTPEVKQAIADEVRRQIERERAEGQTADAPGSQDMNIFADNVPHVFVVHATFGVSSNAGECYIGEGDVLQMNGAPPLNSPSAELVVLASRGQDCRKGSRVSVDLQDLQEMHNQMLATIDRGMGDLQAKQGQGGLPMLPQGSAGTIDSPYAQEARPDSNVANELTSVYQDADRAEQQAVSQAGDVAPGPPPTLSLGLSIEDVKAIQGEPQKIVDLGSKKIYMYKDLKITFVDGRVSDIQ